VGWVEETVKVVAGANFIACHNASTETTPPTGPLHVKVYGCMLQLTCFSGAAVTLVYKEETMAALWALRCLTEGIDGVLGAIVSGSLTRWEASFWGNSAEMPARKDTVKAMMKAEARWTRRGKNFYLRRTSTPLSGAPPNVSRETPQEM
jgi:hypothetical protein